MNYNMHDEDLDKNKWLSDRLLKARNIPDDPSDFFNPTFSRYRQSPWDLNDMEKAVTRIIQAIENEEKIMIFGDYDADGVCSSFSLYKFFKRFLQYKNISIRLPHRLDDGYGIKSYHLDQIKELWVQLVITVDNGITAVEEAEHAKNIGIDLLITDHHKQIDQIPDAVAVVNPQISENYRFKEISGTTVVFKLIHALTERLIEDKKTKDKIFHYFMPLVTIATVADCMPLLDENRLLVKYGLACINQKKWVPRSIQWFLDSLNIKWPLETQHISFMIAPRLNAGGRVETPYESLYSIMYTGEKQAEYLKNLDKLNDQRRKMQDNIAKEAEELMDPQDPVIIVWNENFHEGIIGIVAGRLADKYNKPTIVYSENQETGFAVASLRSPEYASVIDMLYASSELLERYGGHKQAGWLTIKTEKISMLRTTVTSFAKQREEVDKRKVYHIDTVLYPHELTTDSLQAVESFAPFWENNKEPTFLLENVLLEKIEKVWKNGNWHLKMYGRYENTPVSTLFWGAGSDVEKLTAWMVVNIIGILQKDDFRGWVYLKWVDWELVE